MSWSSSVSTVRTTTCDGGTLPPGSPGPSAPTQDGLSSAVQILANLTTSGRVNGRPFVGAAPHRETLVIRGAGTALNVTTVLVGSGLGMLLGHRLPERTRSVVTDGLGLVTLM